MLTPIVTEIPRRLASSGHDDFVSGLAPVSLAPASRPAVAAAAPGRPARRSRAAHRPVRRRAALAMAR